ncbi:MAG TPA: hypothetical protein DIW44_06045 [Anaerolineaceae bacterium]|nr:hypothetical protein [Anaerolineaceae bacterium]
MKKIFSLALVFIFFILGACTRIQPSNNDITALLTITRIAPSAKLSQTNTPNPTNTPTFKGNSQYYVDLFSKSLIKGDKEIVAGMIGYPLRVYFKDDQEDFYSETLEIFEPEAFLSDFDVILNQEIIMEFSNLYQNAKIYSYDDETVMKSVNGSVTFNSNGRIIEIQNDTASITTLWLTQTPTPRATLDPNDCYSTAMTTYDMNMCAGQKLTAIENKLDGLIGELKGVLDKSQFDLLLQVHEEWLKTANDHCAWEENFYIDGTIRGVYGADCLINQYSQRINDLRWALCEGQGMAGECEASWKYNQ